MSRVKHTISIIVFIVVFVVSFENITHAFSYKMGENDTINSFFLEPRNSVDVLFVGSSHAYSSFSPMELWEKSGISSYNLGSSSQSIPCSYYLIKEGIRTQKPKVIVLETYGAKYDSDYISTARLHVALDGMPFNKTKLEVLTEFLPRTMSFDKCLEYYFPIIRFHSRWKEIKAKDLRPRNLCLKGYHLSFKVTELSEPEPETEAMEVYNGTIEYFQRIINICKENNVELLLCNAPMGKNSKYVETNRKVNGLIQYASARGIPCINFEMLRDKLDLDYNNDFRDNEHLNVYGMEKVMSYLNDYFLTHYDLEDHRNDKEYENWNKEYVEYKMLVEKEKR